MAALRRKLRQTESRRTLLPHGAVQALYLKSGQLETLTTGGIRPHRPNDIVPTPEGGAAFTDPQNWECLRDKPENYLGGRVLHWRGDGETELLCELPGFPNGIIFHPDGSLLVNLTRRREIIRFPGSADALESRSSSVLSPKASLLMECASQAAFSSLPAASGT